MSTDVTKTMLEAYKPASLVHNYFTSLCTQRNFSTESIELDIERDDEEVAVVLTSLEAGARANEANLYTNKEFVPPIYKEKMTIPAAKLLKRLPGSIPFGDVDFQAAGSALAIGNLPKLEKKLRRSLELQASQVFQTGALSLVDAAGSVLFTMNFSPKAAHFPTVGTTWANAAADAPGDIGNLAEVIYRNGKAATTRLTFGKTAWRHFLNNTAVKSLLDKQVFNRGMLQNPAPTNGAVKQGEIAIDGYLFELYTYQGFYKSAAGVVTPYIADDKVVFSSAASDVVAAFGAVPQFPADDGSAALRYLPGAISGQGFSFTPTAWISEDRQYMTLQLAARPLIVPRGIDTFGCLDVVP